METKATPTKSRWVCKVEIPVEVWIDDESKLNSAKEVIIALHGYDQRGEKMLRALGACMTKDTVLLSPNGPFPVPIKTDKGYKEGYAWYFYDFETDTYLIDPQPAIDALAGILKQLKLESRPKRIIGFSQGGYFAPHLAQHVKNVKQIIGIGCEYLVDEYPHAPNFLVDAIHGEKDEVVPFARGKKTHGALLKSGWHGSFTKIDEGGHNISLPIQQRVTELLKKELVKV